MTNTATSPIISEQQFQEYTFRWTQLLDNPGLELDQAFAHGLLKSVDFPILSIVQLVSAVGARCIKAKFMVQSSGSTGLPYFSLALFAADDDGKRLSSYYVSTAPDVSTSSEGNATVLAMTGEEVANSLAQHWIKKWAAVHETTEGVTTVLFKSGYGPLQGYTFDMTDFLEPFFQLQEIGDQKMRVHFGLHEYYSAEAQAGSDSLTKTFGLVLQVVPGTEGKANALFDISMPCPKTC